MGFMDPEGPEEPRTYWIRRAVVAIPVLVVIVAVILLATQLGRGDGPTTAEPPQPTDAPTSPTLKPADSPSPSESPSDSSSPSGDPSRSPSSDPSDEPSGDPTKEPSKEPKDEKPSDPPSTTAPPPKPARCDPGVLRTTLTGPSKIQPEKKVTFEAGVINGGKTTCTFTLDADSYVFRVYSGTDQIWTTKDCAKWFPKVDVELKPEEDVQWKIDWTVQRSKGCDLLPAKLKPGTYAANSLLDGAPPAQQVMQLTD